MHDSEYGYWLFVARVGRGPKVDLGKVPIDRRREVAARYLAPVRMARAIARAARLDRAERRAA